MIAGGLYTIFGAASSIVCAGSGGRARAALEMAFTATAAVAERTTAARGVRATDVGDATKSTRDRDLKNRRGAKYRNMCTSFATVN